MCRTRVMYFSDWNKFVMFAVLRHCQSAGAVMKLGPASSRTRSVLFVRRSLDSTELDYLLELIRLYCKFSLYG